MEIAISIVSLWLAVSAAISAMGLALTVYALWDMGAENYQVQYVDRFFFFLILAATILSPTWPLWIFIAIGWFIFGCPMRGLKRVLFG